MSDNKSLPARGSWHVANLELIAFLTEPEAALKQDWWQELTGVDCESTRKRHERIDHGVFQDTMLSLAIDPLRATWSVGPIVKMTTADGMEGTPWIGPYDSVLASFNAIMERWLREMCPAVNRIAFIAKLMQEFPTREESYLGIARYLHSIKLDPESTDFQYRINRKRISKTIPGLAVNRLSTWHAVKLKVGAHISIEGTLSQRTIDKEYCAGMVSLDINTAHEFEGSLPQSQLVDVWHELVSLGSEIAEKGDVP